MDVEISPIGDEQDKIRFFVEIMNPVQHGDCPFEQQMVGYSPAYTQMLELLSRASASDISVLLPGESGTGKELAAQYLHGYSLRHNSPFVTVECSGLTESLFESELFGHEKSAFTGATHRKPGLVEAARDGTLFLDEIGDIPISMQVKLLRLIESGGYRPVGSIPPRHADFRLICATHRQRGDMVAARICIIASALSRWFCPPCASDRKTSFRWRLTCCSNSVNTVFYSFQKRPATG